MRKIPNPEIPNPKKISNPEIPNLKGRGFASSADLAVCATAAKRACGFVFGILSFGILGFIWDLGFRDLFFLKPEVFR